MGYKCIHCLDIYIYHPTDGIVIFLKLYPLLTYSLVIYILFEFLTHLIEMTILTVSEQMTNINLICFSDDYFVCLSVQLSFGVLASICLVSHFIFMFRKDLSRNGKNNRKKSKSNSNKRSPSRWSQKTEKTYSLRNHLQMKSV